jgi:6-phosphogluconolactonase
MGAFCRFNDAGPIGAGMELIGFESRDAASMAAAEFIASVTESSLKQASEVIIALSGGTSPRQSLTHLGRMELPWDRVWVTLTDERQVPRDHEASNYRLLSETLFLGSANQDRFLALEDGNFQARSNLPLIPLLGMGEDGHFASIFPDASALDTLLDVEGEYWVQAVSTSASPFPRVTLTMKSLSRCVRAGLLVFGDAKKAILENPGNFPVGALIEQLGSRLTVFWSP